MGRESKLLIFFGIFIILIQIVSFSFKLYLWGLVTLLALAVLFLAGIFSQITAYCKYVSKRDKIYFRLEKMKIKNEVQRLNKEENKKDGIIGRHRN